MICKNCKSNVKSDFKYCPYCGERIISDFHDQFEELTPPFLITPPGGPDEAASYYVPAPDEPEPRFELPPAPEGPPDTGLPEAGEPAADFRFPEEPEESGERGEASGTAPLRFGGPGGGLEEPRESGGPEPARGSAKAPYFVFRPESPTARIPAPDPFDEPERPARARVREPRAKREKKAGPGIFLKLLLILLVLAAAGAAAYFGYTLLSGGEAPFQNADFSAIFVFLSGP